MNLGSRIKLAREANGITQEELGRLCGTTKQTIFKYENGIVTNIPMNRLEQIAYVLHVSPSSLLGWSDVESITLIESGISSAGAIRYFPHLKEEREKRNITTATVALSLGIREEDYVRIESGSHLPTVDILYKLSVFFCCSVEYMLGVDSFVPSPSFSPSSADRDLVIAYHAAPPEKQEEIRFSLRNYMRNDSTAQKMA